MGLKFDGSINLTTIGTLAAMLIAIGSWITHVETKIDSLGPLILNAEQMNRRLGVLETTASANRLTLKDIQTKVGP